MIDRCAPLALLIISLAVAPGPGPLAQPATEIDPETGEAVTGEALPETGGPEELAARPQSPEEEEALRVARLETLFERLGDEESDTWERDQNEIWAIWTSSGSPSMDLLMARAMKAMELENFELALWFLNDLVRLAPDFAEAWNKRATVHFLRMDYGRSIADIQRTLALEPRHFGAISGLGMILERLGDKEGAMKAFRRGLEINPHMSGAREAVERLAPDVDGRPL